MSDVEEDDALPVIWVCQGPPVCALVDDAAVTAQQAGCRWCKRIIVDEGGGETVIQPGRA